MKEIKLVDANGGALKTVYVDCNHNISSYHQAVKKLTAEIKRLCKPELQQRKEFKFKAYHRVWTEYHLEICDYVESCEFGGGRNGHFDYYVKRTNRQELWVSEVIEDQKAFNARLAKLNKV